MPTYKIDAQLFAMLVSLLHCHCKFMEAYAVRAFTEMISLLQGTSTLQDSFI